MSKNKKSESNEMKILKAFVSEFSPFHQNCVETMTYDELFEVVEHIVESHKGE